MKIYNTAIKDCIMEIIKDKSPAILFDKAGFADALNNYSLKYMDECYLINQAMEQNLGEAVLLNRQAGTLGHVRQLVEQDYDQEDAVFMVGVLTEVIALCNWNIQVANIDEAISVAIESEIPMYIQAMGQAYYKGIGVAQDYEKAYQLFEKAYSCGGQECFYYLGKMNAEGLGTEENHQKARSYYLEGIANDADASKCYYGLALLKKSLHEDYLDDLLKSNEPEAHKACGDHFMENSQLEEAKDNYYKGAIELDPECCVRYAKMALRNGEEKGLQYLVYSYYQFNAEATEYLGFLFTQGLFVSKDVQRGIDLLNEAVSLGSHKAKELLESYEAV